MVKDLEFERGYYWEEIKNSKDYKNFKSFLIVRWIKLLLATILTFAVVYFIAYQFNIKEHGQGKQQIKSDVFFKLGLYACFIPVLTYAWCLFGKTEDTFMKIFKDLLEARKSSLGQVLNNYNRDHFKKDGLIAFFDEPGFNIIIGKKENVSAYEEVYQPLRDDAMTLLTGDDLRSYADG